MEIKLSAVLFCGVAVLFSAFSRDAYATVVYQNTTTEVGAFAFEGTATVGSDLTTNVDVNELTLAPGSAGMAITNISFIAINANSTAVTARPVLYLWSANGAGGSAGTLLETIALSDQSIASFSPVSLSFSLTGPVTIPAGLQIFVGVGFDNDNGASTISSAQLDNLGGYTFNPATIGSNASQAYFIAPGGVSSNPTLDPFGTAFQADYGFTVTASAVTSVPEPATFVLLGVGISGLLLAGRRRRRQQR